MYINDLIAKHNQTRDNTFDVVLLCTEYILPEVRFLGIPGEIHVGTFDFSWFGEKRSMYGCLRPDNQSPVSPIY